MCFVLFSLFLTFFLHLDTVSRSLTLPCLLSFVIVTPSTWSHFSLRDPLNRPQILPAGRRLPGGSTTGDRRLPRAANEPLQPRDRIRLALSAAVQTLGSATTRLVQAQADPLSVYGRANCRPLLHPSVSPNYFIQLFFICKQLVALQSLSSHTYLGIISSHSSVVFCVCNTVLKIVQPQLKSTGDEVF